MCAGKYCGAYAYVNPGNVKALKRENVKSFLRQTGKQNCDWSRSRNAVIFGKSNRVVRAGKAVKTSFDCIQPL